MPKDGASTRDNGDAPALLGRHGVLEPPYAYRMRQAVGFRYVLVHEYAKVDDLIVPKRLADPSDVDEFARSVATWLPDR
ncbi:HepT-like ribonuclease domain-containing protein [uncultured Friedmanniella sp.]|uniref:HepT-like ribonuclease domain-containing protein n=1 Tax=uncultured Friedmanniella sp. TaxID=335381 RepID=UPI0035C9FF86